jgi:SAM-dependent methyltransferase
MKEIRGKLYVHRSARGQLPPPAKALVSRAVQQARPDNDWNMLKVDVSEGLVSFLCYPLFDQVGHPALAWSHAWRATGHTRREYSPDTAPVLHRKELMVSETYPKASAFRRLTAAEKAAGLLRHPEGRHDVWEARLAAAGYTVKGHQLVKTNPSGGRNATPYLQGVERLINEEQPSGKRVLDVACGNGRNSRWLGRRGYQVTAVDRAPQYRPATIWEAGQQLPGHSSSYDLVLLQYVAMFLSPRELKHLGAEICRVLEPGGLLVVELLEVRTGRDVGLPEVLRALPAKTEVIHKAGSEHALVRVGRGRKTNPAGRPLRYGKKVTTKDGATYHRLYDGRARVGQVAGVEHHDGYLVVGIAALKPGYEKQGHFQPWMQHISDMYAQGSRHRRFQANMLAQKALMKMPTADVTDDDIWVRPSGWRGPKSNPGTRIWVLDWIRRNYTDLQRQTGALTGEDDILGCGGFGCVLPTASPRWVVKITDDSDEAAMVKAVMAARQAAGAPGGTGPSAVYPGVVYYNGRYESDHGKKVFIIVREAVNPVLTHTEVVGYRQAEAALRQLTSWEATSLSAENPGELAECHEQYQAVALGRDMQMRMPLVGSTLAELSLDMGYMANDVHLGNIGETLVEWLDGPRREYEPVIFDLGGTSEMDYPTGVKRLRPEAV